MSKKYIITNITNVDPTVSDNIAAGYALAQDWFNQTTGERFYHKADGVWVSYTAAGTNTESPIMFADVATTAEFVSSYDNGVLGVGATLTSTTDGSIDIDGVTLNLDVVVLVKDQAEGDTEFGIPSLQYQNGVYKVTQAGTPSLPVILTRVDFADETEELYPSQVNILEGTVNINKIFLQKTVDPVLGTDVVLYETNLIPVTPQQILPVIFVDTATTEPLPSCTYANIYPTPVPGMWTVPYPSSATITANTNGPLGTINGVVMGNSFANRNNRILVKNQANPVHNGDYQLIQGGSSTTPWVLQRITTTGGSMVKSAREWKVNNENSTLYGTRYNLVSSSSIAIKIGISNLEYSEVTNTASIIEVTYAELVALKTDSLLIPGQTYLLTDYETTWDDPWISLSFSSGVIEPLYITATDVDELSNECTSKLYPQDIVYYEITGDIGNGEGTEGFTKGKIYRRIDTLKNNDIGTDWRHITYRRYAFNVTNEYVAGDSYVKGDVVDSSGEIYVCVLDDPNSESINTKWVRFIFYNGPLYSEKRSREESGISITAGGLNSTIPADPLDFEDVLMFPSYDNPTFEVNNNTISTYKLHNSVIYYNCKNNIIGDDFTINTIHSITDCNSGRGFYGNNIIEIKYCTTQISSPNNGFEYNNIHVADSNTIDGRFSNNFISGTSFKWNTIDGDFTYSIIRDSFISNEVKGDFYFNIICSSNFNTTELGIGFTYNTIMSNVNLCKFGADNNNFNITSDFTVVKWHFDDNIDGSTIALPNIGNEYTKRVIKANGTYIIEYIDEYGDDIIADQLETFVFRSNLESFRIYGSNAGLNPVLIEWGDGSLWKSDVTSFDETHAYPGKLNTDEYNVRIAGVDLTSLGFDINELTFFDASNLPNTLVELNLSNNLLTIFDPSAPLPISLQYLYLGNNLLTSFDSLLPSSLVVLELDGNDLTSFDPSIALPDSLNTFNLQSNNLTSFDPSIALPDSLTILYLDGNDLTSFDPSIALPSSLTTLGLTNNNLTSFDPSIALPSSLTGLYLGGNDLTVFDPSIALPSSLDQLNISANQITSFDPSIALPSSLTSLGLSSNQLTSFDPSIALPSSLGQINLAGNQITSFDPSIALPGSLTQIDLSYNPLATFDPSVPLPNSLMVLGFEDTLLTTFDPSIALPSSLRNLYFNGSQLTSFDPSIALPVGFTTLQLGDNQLTSFNPTLPLPITLNFLYLINNQLSTTEVNNTLVMLNNRYTSPGSKFFYLQMNPSAPPSGAGLTAKAALQAKGYVVQTN